MTLHDFVHELRLAWRRVQPRREVVEDADGFAYCDKTADGGQATCWLLAGHPGECDFVIVMPAEPA